MTPWPSGLVMATSAAPPGSTATTPTMDVALTTTGVAENVGGTVGGDAGNGSKVWPPMVTTAAERLLVPAPLVSAKPVPVIVTCVPPGPMSGEIEVMVGW